ncbi:hypothetical protein, partial [Prosthecobacter sp.]|uniref:hypothetical protein n=1 Tax=Prosthecobacter sp. TaxID=1965333 RepID=UPI0025D39EC0
MQGFTPIERAFVGSQTQGFARGLRNAAPLALTLGSKAGQPAFLTHWSLRGGDVARNSLRDFVTDSAKAAPRNRNSELRGVQLQAVTVCRES